MEKNKVEGLYKDEKNEVWVVIHLDDGDELEWGEDISYKYGLPSYSLITSGNCDFLDIEYTSKMNQLSDTKYDCIQFEDEYCDYAYVDAKTVKQSILIGLQCVRDFDELVKFVNEYGRLITALGKE